MKIGELSRATATKVTTIRFYEEIGLLDRPVRTESNRRTYALRDVDRLNFVRNGRRLGFSIEEIRSLIALACQSASKKDPLSACKRDPLRRAA